MASDRHVVSAAPTVVDGHLQLCDSICEPQVGCQLGVYIFLPKVEGLRSVEQRKASPMAFSTNTRMPSEWKKFRYQVGSIRKFPLHPADISGKP